MNIVIDWAFLGQIALGVVGIIEFVKGFAPKAPSWIWRILLPIACVVVAIAADGGVYQVATNAIMLLALCEFGYKALVKNAKALAKSIGEKIGAKP